MNTQAINYNPSPLSQISHELRIPIAGIIGMTHLLNETTLTSQQKEYLQAIVVSAQRLLGLEGKIHNLIQAK